jgi:DNA repair exonuclease SbcCD nuclease subunit
MSSFCFVHAADLHLDTPFEGIRAEAPEVATALRDASLDAWDALVDLCIARNAVFLLLAGDLYDGVERGVRAQLRFCAGLERLAAAGIRVFAVHGNHDPCDEGWSAIHRWPEGVTFFDSGEVQSVTVEREGECLATVHGVSYATRETGENLARDFRRSSAHGLQIGLLHCNVGGISGHADYSPCSLQDLAASGLDYWALGHIHRHQVLSRGDPWVVYPGVLQGRSPKPSEQGAKGAVVVRVDAGAVSEVEHVALDHVRFLEVEVDVGACRDFRELEEELGSACQAACDQNPDRGLIVRGRLKGRSALGSELARPGVLDDLLETMRRGSEARTPFVWWESLQGRVRGSLDRSTLRSRDDFVSELLELSESLAADSSRQVDFINAQIQELRERQGGVELPKLPEDGFASLLRGAEELALDLLETGDVE